MALEPQGLTDETVLKALVTAFLISSGGQFLFTGAEWQAAIEHAGTLFIHKHEDDGHVLVMLVPAKTARA